MESVILGPELALHTGVENAVGLTELMNLVDVEVERSRYGSRDVILVKEYRKKEKATASADDDALISRLLATKPDAGANLEKREHSAPRGESDENTRRRQQALNE